MKPVGKSALLIVFEFAKRSVVKNIMIRTSMVLVMVIKKNKKINRFVRSTV